MLVFDGHLDLAMNALYWNRDLTLTVPETRALEQGMTDKVDRCRSTVSLPDMRRGNIGLCIATVIARTMKAGNPLPGYRTARIAYAQAHGQLAHYRALEQEGQLRMIRSKSELNAHVAAWNADPATTPIGMILTMEGADPIVYPEQLYEWKDYGLRCLGLTHYGLSNYAHGTATEGGLTDMGRAILPHVKEAGILLDLTHSADQAFWETMELYDGPVQASHQNCRALVPSDRQMDDRQLQAIIERDGVIGAAFDSWMLYPGWIRGTTEPEVVGMEAVADNIDYVCQLAGDSLHAGIGTDLDGGYGTEQCPRDMDTIADLRTVFAILHDRGYSQTDLENIASGNLLRLFRRIWSD
jgi:membrane dipeptidase